MNFIPGRLIEPPCRSGCRLRARGRKGSSAMAGANLHLAGHALAAFALRACPKLSRKKREEKRWKVGRNAAGREI